MAYVHYDESGLGFKAWLGGVLSDIVVAQTTEQTTTSTGTQNDFSLSARYTLLRCNNASDLTITGFTIGGSAPVGGDRVTVVSVGAGNVFLTHQASSTAAYRLINFATVGTTPLAAGQGTATYVYDDTTDRWRLITHEQGGPIDVTFASGNYTASGSMTWTLTSPDQRQLAYELRGQWLTVYASLADTTIGGTASASLKVTIPNSFQANASYAAQVGAVHLGVNAGASTTFYVRVLSADPTSVYLNRVDGADWSLGTNNNDSSFQLKFAVD